MQTVIQILVALIVFVVLASVLTFRFDWLVALLVAVLAYAAIDGRVRV